MSDAQLSFRKSANIDRVTDKRKDSLFRLVDTDGSGTIDAQEFAVLYDAIKKDLAEELEKEAALQQEASSARRRFKMLLLFVAVLVSFLAASVAANFAVIFTVVDQAITTTTTSSGLLEVKGTGAIAKTAIATEDVPLIAAPALDLSTLAQVKSLKVSYGPEHARVEAQLNIVGVRKHNSTFVEFITDVPGETVETLNGKASLVRYTKLDATRPQKHTLCSANATCSAFSASGIDAEAVVESALSSLVEHGFLEESRRLQGLNSWACGPGSWVEGSCTSGCGGGIAMAYWVYHTGYTGLLHVVFGLHGLKGTGGPPSYDNYCDKCQMNKICGTYDSGPCDSMTVPEFEHLVFVFPSSSMISGNKFTWSSSNGVTTTYTAGLENLATFLCGDSDGFDGVCGSGVMPFDIEDDSQVMILGMSNGGGAATFGIVKYAKITGAVAVDFYGYQSITSWLPTYAGTSVPFLKVYTACDSFYYQDIGFTSGSVTFATVYGLSEGAAYAEAFPASGTSPAWFSVTPFTSADSAVYFAVHGVDPCVPAVDTSICHAGKAEQTSSLTHTCTGNQIHNWLNSYADWPNDVLEWVHDPSPPPSPPASSGPTVMPVRPSKPDKGKKKKLPIVTGMPPLVLGPPPTKLAPMKAFKKPNKTPPTETEMEEDMKYPFGKPKMSFSFARSRRFF